jgi:hypothetical protein
MSAIKEQFGLLIEKLPKGPWNKTTATERLALAYPPEENREQIDSRNTLALQLFYEYFTILQASQEDTSRFHFRLLTLGAHPRFINMLYYYIFGNDRRYYNEFYTRVSQIKVKIRPNNSEFDRCLEEEVSPIQKQDDSDAVYIYGNPQPINHDDVLSSISVFFPPKEQRTEDTFFSSFELFFKTLLTMLSQQMALPVHVNGLDIVKEVWDTSKREILFTPLFFTGACSSAAVILLEFYQTNFELCAFLVSLIISASYSILDVLTIFLNTYKAYAESKQENLEEKIDYMSERLRNSASHELPENARLSLFFREEHRRN